MFLDLDLQEEGEWFFFFTSTIDSKTGDVIYDDPDPKARVKVRAMGPFLEKRLSARKKQVEHVLNPKTRAMERIEYHCEPSLEEIRAERDDTYDYVIQDFEGFQDSRTKKVIECNRDNKLKLMRLPVFDRFIARCLQLLSDAGVKKEEQETKNLSTGSSSATTKPDPE
jgi:hypothetical protein